jgi:hypothetical protein
MTVWRFWTAIASASPRDRHRIGRCSQQIRVLRLIDARQFVHCRRPNPDQAERRIGGLRGSIPAGQIDRDAQLNNKSVSGADAGALAHDASVGCHDDNDDHGHNGFVWISARRGRSEYARLWFFSARSGRMGKVRIGPGAWAVPTDRSESPWIIVGSASDLWRRVRRKLRGRC